MTKDHYMALDDLQAVWNNSMKPWIIALGAVSVISITTDYDASAACTITSANDNDKTQTLIIKNTGSTDRIVTLPSAGIYKLPSASASTVTCPAGGYCEVNFLNKTTGGTVEIYVRAL